MIYHLSLKALILILLVLCSPISHAVDSVQDELSGNDVPEDTIWLEEKISPSTQFLENFVKPFTVWVERKINAPTEKHSDTSYEPENANTEILPNTNRAENSPIITKQHAISNAKQVVDGDILHVKFMTETQQYRIKLISTRGQIHILYLDAHSGLAISPKAENKEAK